MYHERSRSADRGTRSSKFDHIRRAGLGFGAYIIGIVAATTLVGALSAPTAQAASDFDGIVSNNTINELELNSPSDPNDKRDYSSNWYSEGLLATELLCNNYGGVWCDNYASFQAITTDPNANWAVFRNDGISYRVVFSTDPNATLNFSEDQYLYINATSIQTATFYYKYPFGASTPNGTSLQSQFLNNGEAFAYGSKPLFISKFPVNYPPGYDGELVPDGSDEVDPLYQVPWNLPASETADCDWWNLTCFMGTVDFNPIRDVTQQASKNLGFIAQFGQVIGELTEMMTAMPNFIGGSVDPCWSTGYSKWCNIPVNIFDQESNISLYNLRNSPVMQAIMPWLLYAMIGLMSWNLFKSLPKIVEDITKA